LKPSVFSLVVEILPATTSNMTDRRKESVKIIHPTRCVPKPDANMTIKVENYLIAEEMLRASTDTEKEPRHPEG
jgi:hypothetical protein